MPCMHCRLCAKQGKTWTARGKNFAERMASLRRHRKEAHPKAHKESTKKALRTKGKLDPLRIRNMLRQKPEVEKYLDFKAGGLVRVLIRKDGSLFPELALYPRPVEYIIDSMKDAGFKQESRGKWVLRTNKFNIFVYT